MARAGLVQSETVRANIVSLVKGKNSLQSYKPIPLEGTLKLSLGKEYFIILWGHEKAYRYNRLTASCISTAKMETICWYP